MGNHEVSAEIRRVLGRLQEGDAKEFAVRDRVSGWLRDTLGSAGWEALLDLASCLWRSGELDIAAEIYDQCRGREEALSFHARALLGRGIIAAQKQDFQTAAEYFEAAARTAGEQHDLSQLFLVRRNQFRLLQDQQKWDELACNAPLWVRADGVLDVELLLAIAAVMHDLERYEEAIVILSGEGELPRLQLPLPVKIRWLGDLARNLRAVGDDGLAQLYCWKALEANWPKSGSEVLDNPESRRDLARIYDLLTGMYTELAENDPTLGNAALYLAEVKKELEFSAPLPGGGSANTIKAVEDELILKLVEVESALERSYKRELGGGMEWELRKASSTKGGTLPEQEDLASQIEMLHPRTAESLVRFRTQLPETIPADPGPWWPASYVGLAYRLDFEELALHVHLTRPGDRLRTFRLDINFAAVRALLDICRQGIAKELEFMADRLTAVFLPEPLRRALWAAEEPTLLLSPDPHLEDVPWEALGWDGTYLGTRFDLVLTPSLARSVQQLRHRERVIVRPSHFLIVANPTGDLPWAAEEARILTERLTARGCAVKRIDGCRHADFLSLMPEVAWLHYAGHANHLDTDPGSSHLRLQDHLLTVREIGALPIAQDSVWILNACESGQSGGREWLGSGTGLTRILVLKGACAVLAANWATADEAGAHTLVQFYRRMMEEQTSLAATMRSVRQALLAEGHSMLEWAQYRVFGHPFVMPAFSDRSS